MSIVLKKTRAEHNIKVLREMKKDFVVERSGSFMKISFDNRVLNFAPPKFGGISGAHISQLVRKDVKQLIPALPEGIQIHSIAPPNPYVNPDVLDSVVGEYCYHVDIKNCYWRVALEKKIITPKTYMAGLRKRKWKLGRNASIGSLDKVNYRDEYRAGELVWQERIPMPANFRYARQLVIDTVDTIAQTGVHEILGDGFVMFLTDCFIVKGTHLAKIKQFIRDLGYSYTEAVVLIKSHDRKNKQICWDKIEVIPPLKPGDKTMIKKETDKYIHYTQRSIVQ